MERVLDVRGLACPLPLIKAREALRADPGLARLVVLATDREAPIDLAALAGDLGRSFEHRRVEGTAEAPATAGAEAAASYWRCVLSR